MDALKFILKFMLLVFLCAFAAVATGGILLIPAVIVIVWYIIHYLATPSKEKKTQKPVRTQTASAGKGVNTTRTVTPPPAPPTHKVCRNCGAQNALDGVYCESCGSRLP